jgi:two-component system, response regulator
MTSEISRGETEYQPLWELLEVLLVEDNPTDAELTVRALREHGFANRIRLARDGAEALEFLFGCGEKSSPVSRPRLILLDLRLPKVNGLEVLERVRADPRTRHMPVVVLSSSGEDPDLESASNLGANAYVVKPVSFEDFIEAVRDISLYWLLVNHGPGE